MPCGGDATQEREFQPKCSRFPYGMPLGRKELPCKFAWTRTRSVASSGRLLTKSPMRFPEGRPHCAGIEIESRGYLWKSDWYLECGPAPPQHPELLPVSISDGATCKR